MLLKKRQLLNKIFLIIILSQIYKYFNFVFLLNYVVTKGRNILQNLKCLIFHFFVCIILCVFLNQLL